MTTTALAFAPKEGQNGFSFSFRFEGEEAPAFHPKMEAFFERIVDYCPYLLNHKLIIESSNSFPHSSGIASSASSMSALALALLSIEQQAGGLTDPAQFNKKASFLARLGSGSAARSIQGPMMSWGETTAIAGSSQAFGSVIQENIHPYLLLIKTPSSSSTKGKKR